MATIASKVLADLRKRSMADVVDLAAFRSAKNGPGPDGDPALIEGADEHGNLVLPAAFRFWIATVRHLTRLGFGLLGSRHLRKFSERIEETEESYLPGGPPMSPLTDSFHMLWSVADLSMGLGKESLTTISIVIARALGTPKEALIPWQMIADSYAGVYRIDSREGDVVTLEELVTGDRQVVAMADPIPGKPGQIWWTRVLPPGLPRHEFATSISTPYLFERPDAEALWLDYFERHLGKVPETKRAAGYRRLMKQGASPNAWFEFILDAYAGVRGSAVQLQGVPDLPETLPTSSAHMDDEDEDDDTVLPLHRLRAKLARVAGEMGLHASAMEDFVGIREEVSEMLPTDFADWQEVERLLCVAYVLFECRDERGRRALDELDHASLDLEELVELQALEAGWFSLFEVLCIKVDEAIEVRDVIRKRRFWITESSATRSLEVGDCLACWIMVEDEHILIEGVTGRVPRQWTPMAVASLRVIVDDMRSEHPSMHWRKRQGLLVPWVSAIFTLIMNKQSKPSVENRHGHPLLLSKGFFAMRDAQAVRKLLRASQRLEEASPDSFVWIDSEKNVSVGQVSLDGAELVISCNSRERLAMMRGWLEETLGDLVTHRASSHEDPMSTAQNHRSPPPAMDVSALPAEARSQIAGMMRQKFAEMLDTKVPMLGNRTPRQAVRSAKGRDDVTSWLLGQERINKANPQMGALMDTSFMWTELGLTHPDRGK